MPVVIATKAAATKTGPTQSLEISDMPPTQPEKYPGPQPAAASIFDATGEGKQRAWAIRYVVNGTRSAGGRGPRDPAIRIDCVGKPGLCPRNPHPSTAMLRCKKMRSRGPPAREPQSSI